LHLWIVPKPVAHLAKNLRRLYIRWLDNAVVHPLAFASSGDQTRTPQVSEVARDLWLVRLQHLNEEADTNLISTQQINNPQTRTVSQGFEK
jgi:hypothetical protein